MKNRKILLWIISILIAATLLFIWGNSLESRALSKEKGLETLRYLKPFLSFFLGSKAVTEHLVRKLAHFVEFFTLGAEFSCLALLLTKKNLHGFFHCLLAGLLTAVIDEALQLLTDRGSQVQDVLLDFAGVTVGIAFFYLLASLRKSDEN